MIYILLLIFTIYISRCMLKYKDNRKISIILSLVFLVVMSTVAGLRSINLGYDAKQYIPSVFYRLNNTKGFFEFSNGSDFEFIFKVISYIGYKVNPNINFLMFCYNFTVTLFVLLFAYKEKNSIPINVTILIYYTTLYVCSYNIIRQSIAIAILMYSYSLLRNNQKIKSFIFLLLAILSHNSAFIAIPVFFIKLVYDNIRSRKTKDSFLLIVTLAIILICFVYEKVIYLFNSLGILNDKFVYYLIKYGNQGIDLNLADTLFKLVCVIIAIMLVIKKNKTEYKCNFEILLIFSIISLAMNIVAFKIYPIYRCGNYYFYISLMYLIPNIKLIFVKEDRKKGNFLAYSIVILFFIWKVFIGNAYLIYPYYSDIIYWLC